MPASDRTVGGPLPFIHTRHKFQFHLPLYRQYHRIQQAGVTFSRSILTNLVKRATICCGSLWMPKLTVSCAVGCCPLAKRPLKSVTRTGQVRKKAR
ncbi:transposase [Halomonas sp. HAL1]|uniref:IS66 family transposase n=1 Tax=Halomonas sp. HAL1 TaxID=550984 RepID=UPI0011129399|nr:transposase [Halomonas sp. HAL1]WKV92684.1 transposase [Halomonas sp. HAL1]